MLNHLDIHWKGYPYHHLPRIRVVSTRPNSIHTRSSTSSGQNSSKIPRIPNDKENRNWPFGIQFRRRRAPASRAASYVVRSQGRASVRARHSIEVFGRATSGAEPASEATTEVAFGSGYRALARRTVFRPESPEDSGFHSTDGPASTSARRVRPPKSEAYSVRSLSEAPVYWTAPNPQKYSFNPDRLYSAQHSIPLRKASNRISTQFPERRISSARPQFKQNTLRKATSQVASGRKTKGVGSPEFWEAVQDYSRNSKAHGRSSASLKSIVETLVSESASRSPSQKRALARFTKGIELYLYLHAAKLPSRESLVSSPSSTSISAHTIQELKPYISEFRAAGLSVTSAEQKGMAKLPKDLTPPPIPSKDEKFEKKRSSPAKNSYEAKVTQANTQSASRNKHASYASQSTGSTVLGWTPPHERSYGRPRAKAKSPSETSSDHTIIGFTPPHELYTSSQRQAPVRPPPSPPQPTTKKSLPWLSRPESSPERSPTQKRSVVSTKVEERKLSTPLTGWVESFDIAESPDKRKKDVPTGKNQPTVPPRPTEKSRQVDRAQPAYEDMGTQTEFTAAVSRHADQYSLERSPLFGNPSNNFSLKANQCNADCVHQSEEPLVSAPPQRSSRPSKLMWKRVGEGTQTIDPGSEPEPGSGVREMKPEGPYQASRVSRSHPKSIHEGRRKWTQVLMNPVEPSAHPAKLECYQAGRNPPSPPLCTRCAPPPVCAQCAGPLDPPKVQPEPQLFSEPRPRPEASHTVTSRMHACTARVSIQCQQCFPSRQVSAAISPTSVSPVELQPVEVYYMDASRRSTRPIIPATAWTGPEELPSPPTVDNVLPESPRSCESPERAQVQSTVEKAIEELAKQEPVADPVKRPSLPRLGFKVEPTLRRKVPTDEVASLASSATASSVDSYTTKPGEFKNKDVFKGLHVVTAAACDNDIDKWIEEQTGSSVRKFLAALSTFDRLGVNTLSGVARRAAKQRRDKVRAWEAAVRERRRQEQTGIGEEFLIGDQGVVVEPASDLKSNSGAEGDDERHGGYDPPVGR
ncbi:hypothetical protein LZ554_002226 [Drepanopeziza brunnea f. sp. 'monogermtubi']|nr:hypothetical protein LZ554_002226 [Drepanopeziza brunnea f. sp. 'monogermtubi']